MQKFEEKDVVRNIVENILSDYKNGRDIDDEDPWPPGLAGLSDGHAFYFAGHGAGGPAHRRVHGAK